MEHYPKWKYREGESRVVQDEEEESALDGKWFDSPADVVPDEKEALLKEAEALGLKLAPQTGVAKIKAAIEEAKKGGK